jgi:hypothetical protein
MTGGNTVSELTPAAVTLLTLEKSGKFLKCTRANHCASLTAANPLCALRPAQPPLHVDEVDSSNGSEHGVRLPADYWGGKETNWDS